jgi:hypothetical protein
MQPGWIEHMPLGLWFRISGDRPDLGLPPTPRGTRYLVDNDPAADPVLNPARGVKERLRRWLGRRPGSPWQGRSGFASITEAWNGAVLASRFGGSGAMVVFGGGHNDYFGADMHAFDLATRRWSRIADGYISQRANVYGAGARYPLAEYPNGSPLPPHTYEYVQYDPGGNDYILFKGQLELGPDVKAVAIPHMFNFDTLSWRRGPRHPRAVLNAGGCTVWDRKRGVLWGNSGDAGGGNAFLCFDPHGSNDDGTFGSWGEMFANKLAGEADHNAMAIDPACDIIVVAVHARDALCAIDPAQPGKPLVKLNTSANRPRIGEYAALEYAPNLGAFVYFSAAPGAAAYRITPPGSAGWTGLTGGKWRWETLQDESNTLDPVTDASRASAHEISITHTFGRFRIATYEGVDVALLVRHIDSPVYAMRLT